MTWMYDMVQDSPRYDEAMRAAMMKLVDYERFRAILLEDNVKLRRMIDIDPEGSEDFIRRLFKASGSQPEFAGGGIVNTLANQPEQSNPYKQAVIDARNAITNEDFFRAQDPTSIEYKTRQQANQYREQFLQRHNERQAQIDQMMSRAQQPQMGQLQKQPNEEMDAFAQTPTAQGFRHIDSAISSLGQALSRGQQQIQDQIAQANPNQPQTGFQSQNVLNIGGLGNLFGLRS